MDSKEQLLKRKRLPKASSTKPYTSILLRSHFFSAKLFLLFFSFLSFFFLLCYTLRINHSSFRPVLVVSGFSLLSSNSVSVQNLSEVSELPSSPSHIEDWILLPDHVLLLVNTNGIVEKDQEFECVYSKNKQLVSRNANNTGTFDGGEGFSNIGRQKVISMDEYDEFRFIVRCPLPPVNYSAIVHLKRTGRNGIRPGFGENGLSMDNNHSVHSWENVAYAATLDSNTVVVFVKGLNLRAKRESDPSQFRCHFGLRNSTTKRKIILTTRAITAAQEIVRCLLPHGIKTATERAKGIRVAVGVMNRVHRKGADQIVLPSVAKAFWPKLEGGGSERRGNYELCVCTMVWNQASALREWIMYHAWLGIERWFVYDNNSDDEIKEVIEELNDYNVTRHVWPWIKTQEAGFSHCALRAKAECNWVAFMDADEFFYFPYSASRGKRYRGLGYAGQNALKALVANFSSSSRVGEIRTNCHSFGPSGRTSPPSQGVTTGYTCRLQNPERHKSIIRPKALNASLLNVVHHFHLTEGFRYLSLPRSTVVINHYKYQVWDVFKAKFYRRVATYVSDWQENKNEGSKDRAPGLGTKATEPPNWSRQFCAVWDTGLRDFVLANLADPSTGLLPWERL